VISLRNGAGIPAGVLDGARSISGYERYHLRVADSSKPYLIQGRVDEDGPGVPETATVSVNAVDTTLTLPLASTVQFQNAVIAIGDAGAEDPRLPSRRAPAQLATTPTTTGYCSPDVMRRAPLLRPTGLPPSNSSRRNRTRAARVNR
jgi:hypothetical protein